MCLTFALAKFGLGSNSLAATMQIVLFAFGTKYSIMDIAPINNQQEVDYLLRNEQEN